jgi:hypothetical protein
MGSANRLCACFRQSKVLHLALLDQVFDSSRNIFDRNLVIDAVLVEKIDRIGFEALERGLGDLPDVLWPAVQPSLLAVLDLEAKFCGDLYLMAEWSQRLTDEFFIRVRTINLRCIEERYTTLDRRANQRNPLLLLHGRAVAKAQPHTAEPNG